MDNPETLETLSTQDKERRKTCKTTNKKPTHTLHTED